MSQNSIPYIPNLNIIHIKFEKVCLRNIYGKYTHFFLFFKSSFWHTFIMLSELSPTTTPRIKTVLRLLKFHRISNKLFVQEHNSLKISNEIYPIHFWGKFQNFLRDYWKILQKFLFETCCQEFIQDYFKRYLLLLNTRINILRISKLNT